MDLLNAYSNRDDLAFDLAHAAQQLAEAGQADSGGRRSVRTGQPPVNTDWRVSDRLSEADVAKIVERFANGTAKSRLAEQYGISLSSVKRLLKKHAGGEAA